MKLNPFATPEKTEQLVQQPSVDSDNIYNPVGWVTVLTLTEPPLAESQAGSEEGRGEGPEESPEENPAETKLDNEDWLRPSPGSPLPESGEVWVNGEDNNRAVSLAEVIELDPAFEEKRKHILVAYLRGERNTDYNGLSPLGVHCLMQLVSWLETSDSNQWDLEGADLRGVDLGNVDLRGMNLEGADLEGARLVHTNLRGVNLRGANIKGADLSYADLREAEMRGPEREDGGSYSIDFGGVNLEGAKVEGAHIDSGSERYLPKKFNPWTGYVYKGSFRVSGRLVNQTPGNNNGSMMGD